MLYFTEAGGVYGLGHIKRFEAFATSLSDLQLQLVLKRDSSDHLNAGPPDSVTAAYWSNENIEKVKELVKSSAGVFIDTYHASNDVFEVLGGAEKVVAIDDYLQREWDRGLIVDWTPGAEGRRHQTGDQSLFGSDYYLPRPSLKRARNPEHRWLTPKKNVYDLAVTTVFGGTDPLDFTPTFHSYLSPFPKSQHIGTSFYPSSGSPRLKSRCRWDLSEDEFFSTIFRSDIVITAAGQTLYELAYLGIPSLSFLTADNQAKEHAQFVVKELTTPLDISALTPDSLKASIEQLYFVNNKLKRNQLSESGVGSLSHVLLSHIQEYLDKKGK